MAEIYKRNCKDQQEKVLEMGELKIQFGKVIIMRAPYACKGLARVRLE